MKSPNRLSSLAIIALAVTSFTSVSEKAGAQTLSVDIGPTLESGFSQWTFGSGNTGLTLPSTTFSFGALTVTAKMSNTFALTNGDITAGTGDVLGSKDRGASSPPNVGSFTDSDFYRDFATNNAGLGDGLALELSGLNPNTSYIISLYSYDFNTTRTNEFKNLTGGASDSLGTVTNGGTASGPTSGGISTLFAGITATITTDSQGRLIIGELKDTSHNNASVLNGFTLTAVPEPSVVALLGISSLVFCISRLKRKARI